MCSHRKSTPGRLLGTTPVWIVDKKESILSWLDFHDCEYYAVIDDNLNMEKQLKTDAKTGLTENDIPDVMRILGYGDSSGQMTKEDAKRYYYAIVGNMPITTGELKADPRLRHMLIHYRGVISDIPEGVDEDEYFEQILNTLGT